MDQWNLKQKDSNPRSTQTHSWNPRIWSGVQSGSSEDFHAVSSPFATGHRAEYSPSSAGRLGAPQPFLPASLGNRQPTSAQRADLGNLEKQYFFLEVSQNSDSILFLYVGAGNRSCSLSYVGRRSYHRHIPPKENLQLRRGR